MDDVTWDDGGGDGSGVKPCTIDDAVITPTRTPTSADEEDGTFALERIMCRFLRNQKYVSVYLKDKDGLFGE